MTCLRRSIAISRRLFLTRLRKYAKLGCRPCCPVMISRPSRYSPRAIYAIPISFRIFSGPLERLLGMRLFRQLTQMNRERSILIPLSLSLRLSRKLRLSRRLSRRLSLRLSRRLSLRLSRRLRPAMGRRELISVLLSPKLRLSRRSRTATPAGRLLISLKNL